MNRTSTTVACVLLALVAGCAGQYTKLTEGDGLALASTSACS
jgi:hypothetical protein